METALLVDQDSVSHHNKEAVDHTKNTANAQSSSTLDSSDFRHAEDHEGRENSGCERQGNETGKHCGEDGEKPESEETRQQKEMNRAVNKTEQFETNPEDKKIYENIKTGKKYDIKPVKQTRRKGIKQASDTGAKMEERKHKMEQETSESQCENEAPQQEIAEQETSESQCENEEPEQEKSEQPHKSTTTEGKETKSDTFVDAAEKLKNDSAEVSPMDEDETEETMEVEEEARTIVSAESKVGCSSDEKSSPDSSDSKPSKNLPKNVSKSLSMTDTPAAQALKDNEKDSPVQTAGMQAEKNAPFPSSSSPLVKVKDEPMDEEYERALAPQDPNRKIKDEPDMNEELGQKTPEMIKISAVFSVGSNSASLDSSAGSSAPSANPPSNSIFSASSLCVVCSGCKKVLLKGQTAFQRKGSPQLYCSPRCLCTSTSAELVATSVPKKTCHHCLKDIPNLKDLIIAKVDKSGTMKDFCSQKCLGVFNYKRDGPKSALALECAVSKCSVCQKVCATMHEVNFMDSVKKMCSNTCFHQFCSTNKLTMNCCSQCGDYCYNTHGKCPAFLIDGTIKKLCSQACVAVFKKKYTKSLPCTMCQVYRNMSEMVESLNTEGNCELFCSSACVTAHKVQKVSSSGAALECNNCKQIHVPQYHLAMSDGTIRNFCSFTCVVAFQDSFNKTNSQTNQLASPSQALSESTESTSTGTIRVPPKTRVTCSQCLRMFSNKPELQEFKGKMYLFCDKACIDEFRRSNYIMAQCVYCKLDKVVKEVKRINNADRSFCSEGCKLLYKHDLAKRWGKKHCRNCLYCGSTSQSVVTSVFANKQEEFCGNECLSQYTLLYCEVAKCSMCTCARKMSESVKWLGEIKHFCNLPCLAYFCSLYGSTGNPSKPTKPVTQVPITIAPASTLSNSITTLSSLAVKEATPVIANVISLSNAPNGQPNVLGGAALQGAVPTVVKLIGHASTQTDGVKMPAAPQRILKNKALLCKPMSQNKGTACKPNTSDMNTQTDEDPPKVIVLPVPVPVFVPMPMHLYTQYTPQVFGLPLPVPVPMFLPVTLDNAERLVETIQEIKEKIPDNPLEADLIMMAEMVAEDSEKDKAISHGDQDDNFIEDFDLEALSSHLSWEEDSVSSASRWGRNSEPEKVPPPKPRSPSPSSLEPQMDLEKDFPIESFDHRGPKERMPTVTKSKTRKKSRDAYCPKKRARKRSEASSPIKAGVQHGSKLHSEYGIQAWKSWIRWRNTQPSVDMPKIGSRNMTLKEDLLQCSTTELSYGLSRFVTEVQRPNGESYSPDSIYYLCLGIQQFLFENSRMENIFADVFYTKFSQTISNVLKDWKPSILPSGYVHSRVEEEYLWECKQLGAFSPSVLLNTLLYFCTKFFGFKTVAQHRRLSFAHIMRCSRTSTRGNKRSCLRFYPPVPKETKNTSKSSSDSLSAKRKREEEDEEGVVLEMQENSDNPLRCPVRLYEFYLSKCSSSVKQRTTVFFLRPERSCVPNSPLWFSSVSLDDEDLDSMLARILTVREIHLKREKRAKLSDTDAQTDSD